MIFYRTGNSVVFHHKPAKGLHLKVISKRCHLRICRYQSRLTLFYCFMQSSQMPPFWFILKSWYSDKIEQASGWCENVFQLYHVVPKSEFVHFAFFSLKYHFSQKFPYVFKSFLNVPYYSSSSNNLSLLLTVFIKGCVIVIASGNEETTRCPTKVSSSMVLGLQKMRY